MFTKGNSFVFVINNRAIRLSKDNKINLISTIVWCFDLSGWTWNLQEGSGRQCLCCGDALRLLSDITCRTDLCLFSSLVNVYFTAKQSNINKKNCKLDWGWDVSCLLGIPLLAFMMLLILYLFTDWRIPVPISGATNFECSFSQFAVGEDVQFQIQRSGRPLVNYPVFYQVITSTR